MLATKQNGHIDASEYNVGMSSFDEISGIYRMSAEI